MCNPETGLRRSGMRRIVPHALAERGKELNRRRLPFSVENHEQTAEFLPLLAAFSNVTP
jgi:hypothetical protein